MVFPHPASTGSAGQSAGRAAIGQLVHGVRELTRQRAEVLKAWWGPLLEEQMREADNGCQSLAAG